MPLQVSTTSPTHDLTLTIDDEPVRAHVKRFTKDEGIAFMRDFVRLGRQRGATLTDEKREEREAQALAFLEQSISAYLTFEPGDVVGDEHEPIVTGAQIVKAFQFRLDVLGACYQAIYSENCLGKAQKKILNSQGIFLPGSTPSTPTPAGAGPDQTAIAAAPSSTATAAAATDAPNPSPSGPARGQVH